MPIDLKKSGGLAQAADQCVKCGLCLPHCPTYRLLNNEGDSPRGRISLMQGFDLGDLNPDGVLKDHIDGCLLCGNCERVCPAKVPFKTLLVETRQRIHASDGTVRQGMTDLSLSWLSASGSNSNLGLWLLLIWRWSGLQRIARVSRVLPERWARLEACLPKPTLPFGKKKEYRPEGSPGGKIALFTGCMGRTFDSRTLKSSVRVLNQMGLTVTIINDATCCGAMAYHQGDLSDADRSHSINQALFETLDVDAIVVTSSACAAHLARAIVTAPPVVEICRFITGQLDRTPGQALRWRTPRSQRRIGLHTPCSQKNDLKDPTAPRELLGRIPELEIVEINDPLQAESGCCGGAGRYFLDHPGLSKRLRTQILNGVPADIQTIATTNIGCSIHLAQGCRERRPDIEIMHPMTYLAEQII